MLPSACRPVNWTLLLCLRGPRPQATLRDEILMLGVRRRPRHSSRKAASELHTVASAGTEQKGRMPTVPITKSYEIKRGRN